MSLPDDQSRYLLAAIVDSSEDAIISKDLNGLITSWNRAAEALFGYSAQEVIGQSILILFPEERLNEEQEILERIKRGEQIRHYETVRRRRDGSLLNLSLTVSPIKDTQGHIIGASKIARDITVERGLLQKMQQSEQRFRVTLESIGDAVIATDGEGRIEFLNPVAEKLTGWRREEAQGLPLDHVFKIVNEYTGRPVESPVVKILRDGVTVGLANHTVLISKDGKEYPIDDTGAPIHAGKSIAGVALVFRDVTERRAADLAARRLAAIVENSDDAIIGKDLTGKITSWNQGAERIFGYSPQEILGKSITVLIPWELRAQEDEILRRLRHGERIYHFETRRVAKDKTVIPVSLTISPIKDADGTIVGASKIARVISP